MLLFHPTVLSLLTVVVGIVCIFQCWAICQLERDKKRLRWSVYLSRYREWEAKCKAHRLHHDWWELYRALEDVEEMQEQVLSELKMGRSLIRQGKAAAGMERIEDAIRRLERAREELETMEAA